MFSPRQPPAAATQLGYAGLIPFVGLAALQIVAPALWPGAAEALLLYGAVILSFMGGCRWGFSCAGLGAGPTISALAIAVTPALFGWAALLARPWIGPAAAALLLALGFIGLLMSDFWAARTGDAPDWWPALRQPLTIGASASLLFFATLA